MPTDIPDYKVDDLSAPIYIPQLLTDAGVTKSNSEARRSIKAGAFKINGEKCQEETVQLAADMVLQVGKRKFIKIK